MQLLKINGKVRNVSGWKPDQPDHRDFRYSPSKDSNLLPIDGLDLQGHWLSPIEDQESLGACTGNALTSNMEFLLHREGFGKIQLSRMYSYYFGRFVRGTPYEDTGCSIRESIKGGAIYGSCPENLWPYEISRFTQTPSHQAQQGAKQYRLKAYCRLHTLEDLRSCIASGYGFAFGFSVPESIDSEKTARTGVVEYPDKNTPIVGGHAVFGIGYDDKRHLIKARNSWGDFGDQGHLYIPYAFFQSGLAGDAWMIRLV